jgi:hypothetical protein
LLDGPLTLRKRQHREQKRRNKHETNHVISVRNTRLPRNGLSKTCSEIAVQCGLSWWQIANALTESGLLPISQLVFTCRRRISLC